MLTNDDLINMGISEDDIRILNQYDAMLGSVENAQSELEVVSKEYAKSVDESRQSIVDMITATESYNVLTAQEQNMVKKAISNMTPEELIRKWQMASNNTGGYIINIKGDTSKGNRQLKRAMKQAANNSVGGGVNINMNLRTSQGGGYSDRDIEQILSN